MVVEVVLADHVRAVELEQPGKRVTHGSPTRAAQVNGAGGVGGHKFDVDGLARERFAAAVLVAVVDDAAREFASCRLGEANIDKPGACNLGGVNALDVGQALHQRVRKLARVGAGLLGQLHRDVGGPVAVFALAGPLHLDGLGYIERRQLKVAVVDSLE